ncbi:MAG: hypothetical protein HYZ34_12650 [Ignavibacteriae bacterium]|nr:hypothetical protein [Ignavibacteriota bacterium]
MNSILDIIGSTLVYGILTIALVSVSANLTTSSVETKSTFQSEQNLLTLYHFFEYDFLKIGLGKTNPKFKSGACESLQIMWYSDYDENGKMDSIMYYLNNIQTTDRGTINKTVKQRPIFRKLNTENPIEMHLNIVSFTLTYLDANSNQLPYDSMKTVTGVNKVRGIKVRYLVEDSYSVKEPPQRVFIEKTYYPKNLLF